MGKVTAGYKYFVGMHLGICSGPVDALLQIRAGDLVAWNGQRYTSSLAGDFNLQIYTPTGTPAPCTSNERLVINAPEIFGGDEKEGGLLGEMDVMFGREDQTPNDYLVSQHGAATPAYRGLFGIVWRRGQVSSNNPYIKPWAFKVRRILQGWQTGTAWYAEKAAITLPNDVGQAMNPAHIIYQCITDDDWGLGYGSSLIDDASFRAAADTFFAEGLGLCLKWTRQGTIESFVQVVMDHAGAILAQDRTTGLFKLLPLRADYTVSALPLFNESNITTLDSYQRPSLPDAVNEISVKFDDIVTGQEGSVTVQNLANITAQGGVVTQPKQYPGLPTAELATRVAMRDLRAVSTPLAKVRFRCNRAGAGLLPGQVVRFSWAKLGIEQLVLRLVRVNTGTLTDGDVEIEAVEDVFAMPSASYAAQQPTGWVDPAAFPQEAENRVVREANWYELQQELGTEKAQALPEDAGYIVAAASSPGGNAQDFALRTKASSASEYDEADRAPLCPSGSLTALLSHTATTATLANLVDADLLTRVGYAQIDAEIVRINSLNPLTGAVTFARGVCGTVAAQHAEGARVFFLDGFLAVDPTERVDAEVVNVKLTPRTGRGELPESIAPVDSITLDQVAARPYAPGRFRVAGQAYPTLVDAVPELSWVHRDRLQQNLEGDDVTGNIGPEAGTTYTAEIRNGTTDALLVTAPGISGTTYTPSGLPAVPRLKVRLWAVRGGLASAQRHEWTFDYTAPTIAGGATFGIQAAMVTGASSGGFIGAGNALRGVMSFGGVLVATDNDTGSTKRIYTSSDGGATWALGYEGSAPVSYSAGVNTWDVVVGSTRLAYAINTTAGIHEVLTAADNTTAPTVNTSKPTVGGALIDPGAVYSDGTTVYIVGRLSSQLEAPGAFNLYSSTDGLTFTSVGAMTQDPADPNATPGANSGFDSRLFVPSGLFSGDEFSRLKKFGSRWFLVGRQAIYYTDEAVPRTLWKRCPLGLNDGATSPTITIEGLEKVGTKLVAWKSNVPVGGDVNPIAYSSDDGVTWATTRPAALGSLDTLSREGYVFGGRLHIVTHSSTGGATRILHAADPAGAWSLQTSTPFDAYAQALYPLVTGSEVVITTTIGSKRALVRSTDGVTFSAVSGIAGNPTAIASGRLFTTSAAILNGSATGGSGATPALRLLMHFDGVNNSTTFTDSSTFSRTPTVSGDAKISTAQSKFPGGASGFFDGTGDVVRFDHSSTIDPLAQDFTLECFFRTTTTTVGQIIVTKSITTGDYPFQLWFNTGSGRIQARSYDGAVGIFDFGSTGPAISVNTWYHVALCRSGGTVRLFIDGVQTGTASIGTAVLKSNTGPLCIGGYSDGTFSTNGYIDELRLLIGSAAYTADFTPPTAPFGDPVGATVLLLHFDGANNSTTFTDSSGYNRPATVLGDAKLTTTSPMFGAASGLFNALASYLTFPDSPDFNPGAGDFTIECFIRLDDTPGSGFNYGIACKGSDTNRAYLLYVPPSTRNLNFTINDSTGALGFTATLTDPLVVGQWHHVAAVREGRKMTIFIDGAIASQDATALAAGAVVRNNTTAFAVGNLYPGQYANCFFKGRIDEFRYTKGAVYTAAFAAPTAPFSDPVGDPAFASVSLLLHANGANGSTTFIDSSSAGLTPATINGNTQITTSTSAFAGGQSIAFDGAGDDIRYASSTAFDLGNTYTVEFWARFNDVGRQAGLLHRGAYNTSGTVWTGLAFSIRQLNDKLRFYFYATTAATEQYIDTAAGSIATGAWYHIAMVRSGTNGQVFINGVSAGTLAGLNSPAASSEPLILGNWLFTVISTPTNQYLDGYLDEIRITKGVARYTANFTPVGPFPDA